MSCLSWISCAQPSRHASVEIVGVVLWCVAHSGFNRSPKGFDAGCHQLDGVFKLMCGGLILACLIVLTCIATGPVLLLVKRTAPMWPPCLSSKMRWVFAAQFVFVAPATYSLLLYTFGFVRFSMHLLSMHCFRHTCARAHTHTETGVQLLLCAICCLRQAHGIVMLWKRLKNVTLRFHVLLCQCHSPSLGRRTKTPGLRKELCGLWLGR